ncbi:MAG: hypothetical protein Q9160_008641 [Pyrenula sp. 1 TL-2023]
MAASTGPPSNSPLASRTVPISTSLASPADLLATSDSGRLRKRNNTVETSSSPLTSVVASGTLDTSEVTSSPRPGKRVRLTPQPMTAAAAIADQQQKEKKDKAQSQPTSPNPAKQALGVLMGIDSGMSKDSHDASAAARTISKPLAMVAESIQVTSDDAHADQNAQTSPVSLSSFVTVGTTSAPTAIADPSTVASPSSMEDTGHEPEGPAKMLEVQDGSPDGGNKALSYPGPLHGVAPNDPRRGMSLPHSGARQGSPRASSLKKHKCERPHICPKCGRKFARGDALARHNKGPGGCAGRRSSVGSYGGEDDYEGGGQDDSMDGLVYTVEPERMEDDEGDDRRQSMPTIKRSEAPNDTSQHSVSSASFRQPSTYPPIQGRPPGGVAGGLFPPPTSHGGSSSSTSPLSQNGTLPFPQAPGHQPTQGSTVFPQGAMTESPKPLSPGTVGNTQHNHSDSNVYRNRSPSLTQQYHHQMFGRGSGRGRTPPAASGSLPPPQQIAPQLPPPTALNPPDSRYTLHSQATPTHPPAQPTGPPTHMSGGISSQSNSLSSHAPSHQGSGEGASAGFPSREDRLWEIVRVLEHRVNSLQQEVSDLKGQLAAAAQPAIR